MKLLLFSMEKCSIESLIVNSIIKRKQIVHITNIVKLKKETDNVRLSGNKNNQVMSHVKVTCSLFINSSYIINL